MKVSFKPQDFFDLSVFPFKNVFIQNQNVWEVLPQIGQYIENQFEKGMVKGNYKRNIFIGEGTVIQEGALIIGPAIIGKNCFIGHASLLRENCLLGNNVHVGHGVEVKNSIFLNNATAAHLNYIGDSVVGARVNISGGAILANFRLDKNLVSVRNRAEKISTNLLKFGSIIGDDSSIGVNSVLNPGTILGKKSIVYPLKSVTGVHENGEIIK